MTPSARPRANAGEPPAWMIAACFGIPAALLAACYAWLAADRGTLRLWSVVVHESGRYTLGETMLYFGHFLREVPTDIAYALFLLGAAGGLGRSGRPIRTARARALGWLGLGAAAVLVAAALALAAATHGWSSALRDLMQFRTRDDLIAYGSHWRFHWLSTLWFGAAVGLAPSFAARMSHDTAIRRSRTWQRAGWVFFGLLTAIFGLSTDVFTDTRYVGHQAREILTHGPVTALLGIGALMSARTWLGLVPDSNDQPLRTPLHLAGAIAIPGYVAMAALSGDVMAAGQSDRGLAAMVAAHYFEHSLDYVLVVLLVIGALGFQSAYRQTEQRVAADPGAAPAGRMPAAP